MKQSYLNINDEIQFLDKYMKIVNFFLRLADQVLIGDELLVHENETVFPAKVINMSSSRMQGDYTKYLKLFSFLIYFVMFFDQCSFML